MYASRAGVKQSGVGAAVVLREPAKVTWPHCEACAWTAAWVTVRGRHLVGGRELLVQDEWSGELSWKERGESRGRRHRPDLAIRLSSGGVLPVEVELTEKATPRLEAVLKLHRQWVLAGKSAGVIYVCGSEDIAQRVTTEGEQAGLSLERRTFAGRAVGHGPARSDRSAPPASGRRLASEPHGGGVMLRSEVVAIDLLVTLTLAGTGVLGAWWLRRRTTLSAQNLYAPAAVGSVLLVASLALHAWVVGLVMMPLVSPWFAGSVVGARWRTGDLGAGEELRNHELARRWIWQPAPESEKGERLYMRSQGELVHERSWPKSIAFVSMTSLEDRGPRLPLGAGQHIVMFGATGAGKTTTARRLLAGRTLAQKAALLILDQKGDPDDVEHMKVLAAAAGVPFILFDSQDPETDRWQPLWGTPDGVAARAVEPIRQSEPYYYDVLRRHLDVVANVLHAAEMWPPSIHCWSTRAYQATTRGS